MLSNSITASVSSSGAPPLISEPAGTGEPLPPTDLVLRSGSRSASTPGATCILSLPTMLYHSISSWLTDRESLQLILSNRYLRHEVESYYRHQLREEVAQLPAPIERVRNPVNVRPSVLGMKKEGEEAMKNCLSMKVSGQTEAQYHVEVIDFFKKRLTQAEGAERVLDITLGVALGLGGTFMPAQARDAMLATILTPAATTQQTQRPAMMLGLCIAFGRNGGRAENFEAALNKILSFHQTTSPVHMGELIHVLCNSMGGERMKEDQRRMVVEKILAAQGTCSRDQIQMMICNLFQAFGGSGITAENREDLMRQIWDIYDTDRTLPLGSVMSGTFLGLGGPDMSASTRDAVLARIFDFSRIWSIREMGVAIGRLFHALGGMQISAENRDAVLAKIMVSNGINAQARVGSMIWIACFSLNGGVNGAKNITAENLGAVMDAIISARATCSKAQLSAMLNYLFLAVGAAEIAPAHREMLTTRIEQSGHFDEFVAAIRVSKDGQVMMNVLKPG